MKHYIGPNQSATPPTVPGSTPDGYATEGDPGTATPASTVSEWWVHSLTSEIVDVVTDAGLTPAANDLTQLRQAIDAKVTAGLGTLGTASTKDAGTATLADVPQVSDIQNQTAVYAADTGAANAYVITLTPAPSAYAAGQRFAFKATNANTTTSTLNVNALGVKTLKKNGGVDNLETGNIVAGQIVEVEYDGTNLQVVSPIVGTTPIFTKAYESTAQTITSGGTLTLAHGMGISAKIAQVWLKCVSAEGGYSVNDEVLYLGMDDGNTSIGASIVPDTINLNIRYGSQTKTFKIVDKSDGSTHSITNSSWNCIFKAYA